MRFVIVTGMSGAGKTTALKMLEDMGYFCVDNLPIAMFPGFVQMIENSETPMKKVALGVDVRSGQDISGLEKDLEQMDQKGIKYEILFLDAKDSVLVKRYKETRRQPSTEQARSVSIKELRKRREKTCLFENERATLYYRYQSASDKRAESGDLKKYLCRRPEIIKICLSRVLSFGFKYGIPAGFRSGFRCAFSAESILRG